MPHYYFGKYITMISAITKRFSPQSQQRKTMSPSRGSGGEPANAIIPMSSVRAPSDRDRFRGVTGDEEDD